MQTKSRYEVIAELEEQKRNLIQERDSLQDQLTNREKSLKKAEREKSDTIMVIDRKIEDMKEDVENYKQSMAERKETINELIKSVDDSLKRFGELSKSKD